MFFKNWFSSYRRWISITSCSNCIHNRLPPQCRRIWLSRSWSRTLIVSAFCSIFRRDPLLRCICPWFFLFTQTVCISISLLLHIVHQAILKGIHAALKEVQHDKFIFSSGNLGCHGIVRHFGSLELSLSCENFTHCLFLGVDTPLPYFVKLWIVKEKFAFLCSKHSKLSLNQPRLIDKEYY